MCDAPRGNQQKLSRCAWLYKVLPYHTIRPYHALRVQLRMLFLMFLSAKCFQTIRVGRLMFPSSVAQTLHSLKRRSDRKYVEILTPHDSCGVVWIRRPWRHERAEKFLPDQFSTFESPKKITINHALSKI